MGWNGEEVMWLMGWYGLSAAAFCMLVATWLLRSPARRWIWAVSVVMLTGAFVIAAAHEWWWYLALSGAVLTLAGWMRLRFEREVSTPNMD